jgi:hypothetical protein
MRVTSSNPKGWRSGTFKVNETINDGSYIWFGLFTEYLWLPRFDYGVVFWNEWWDDFDSIPNTYPYYKNSYQPSNTFNFKLSMYFNYTSSQSYVRKITQGVNLSDNRKLKIDYKRSNKQTVQSTATVKGLQYYYRLIQEAAHGITFNDRQILNADYKRITQETVTVNTITKAMFFFFIKIQEKLNTFCFNIQKSFNTRIIQDNSTVTETLRHYRNIFVGLFDNTVIDSEVKTAWIFTVKIADTVHAVGSVFRGLLIFVKILTPLLVRDYIIGRFLISKKEIKIKSLVTKNISINSKFH